MEIVWFRNLFGLLFLGAYMALFHRDLLKFRWKDLWCFACLGFGSMFLSNLTYNTAIQHTSLAVAGVLLYTSPIFVMLLSALLFREAVTKQKLAALVIVFLGCILVSGIGSDSQISTLGLLWGLSSGITYASYSIFSRYAIERGYGSWTITFWAFVFCFTACSFFCDWSLVGTVWTSPAELSWAAALGIITSFLPYVLYGLGLATMENSRASILASVEPVVATLFSVLLFHESMGIGGIIGMVLVLSAIVMLSRNSKKTH